MEFKFSYNHIIAHIFPGIVLSLELVMFLHLITPNSLIRKIFSLGLSQAMVVFLLVVSGTFLGILIDAFQHYLFEDLKGTSFLAKLFPKISSKLFPKMPSADKLPKEKGIVDTTKNEDIKTEEQLAIYNDLVMESYYYYYEAWMNSGLSLLPLIFILPPLFIRLCIPFHWVVFSEISLILIIIVMFYEGTVTHYDYYEKDEEVLNSFNNKTKKG